MMRDKVQRRRLGTTWTTPRRDPTLAALLRGLQVNISASSTPFISRSRLKKDLSECGQKSTQEYLWIWRRGRKTANDQSACIFHTPFLYTGMS